MTLRLVTGNLLLSKRQTLTNTVNCVGVMGKGIALEFKRRYPDMFTEYVRRCDAGSVHPGQPYVYALPEGRLICNFPTKNHWRGASRLEWIRDGLDAMAAGAAGWGVENLALPPLGCGHGGLNWDQVLPLIRDALGNLPFDVDVYVPSGVDPDPPAEEQLAFGL